MFVQKKYSILNHHNIFRTYIEVYIVCAYNKLVWYWQRRIIYWLGTAHIWRSRNESYCWKACCSIAPPRPIIKIPLLISMSRSEMRIYTNISHDNKLIYIHNWLLNLNVLDTWIMYDFQEMKTPNQSTKF